MICLARTESIFIPFHQWCARLQITVVCMCPEEAAERASGEKSREKEYASALMLHTETKRDHLLPRAFWLLSYSLPLIEEPQKAGRGGVSVE